MHATEKNIYERLGVVWFRDMLFQIEMFRHRSDGGRNLNYHLHHSSASEVEQFRMYLIYNAWLHILSGILIIVVQILEYILSPGWDIHELPAILLMILNLWCLMLQRYNDLRIRAVSVRHKRLFVQRVQKLVLPVMAKCASEKAEQLQEDLTLVKKLRSDVITTLWDTDIPQLQHLTKLVSDSFCSSGRAGVFYDQPVDQLAARYKASLSPKEIITLRAERLLLQLRLKQYLPSKAKVVVTMDGDAEEAYYTLLGGVSAENKHLKLAVLEAALTMEILQKEENNPIENADLL